MAFVRERIGIADAIASILKGIFKRCREEGDARMTGSSFPLPDLFKSPDEGCPAAQAVLFPLYPVMSDR